MMLARLVLALVAVSGLATTVQAADQTFVTQNDPPEIQIANDAIGHGWYIRGDLSYNAGIGSDNPALRKFDGTNYTNANFDTVRFGKDVTGSAGLGYQFNDWLRGDFTGDYFTSGLSGFSTSASPCGGAVARTTCRDDYNGRFEAIGLMANGYVDLGTVSGFTPYIGGGLGSYQVSWNKFTDTVTCVNGAGTCAATNVATLNSTSDSNWRFAYAFMAGVSFDVSPQTKIDLGYRYSRIGAGDVLKFSNEEAALGGSGVKASDGGISRHEIRLGLRVNFW
jgi:opacity protein-like surface antigen